MQRKIYVAFIESEKTYDIAGRSAVDLDGTEMEARRGSKNRGRVGFLVEEQKND